jgi:hypothetical protein
MRVLYRCTCVDLHNCILRTVELYPLEHSKLSTSESNSVNGPCGLRNEDTTRLSDTVHSPTEPNI